MGPLELLAEMPGSGLEPSSHHLKRHHKHMLKKGPNGMKLLQILAEMPGSGLELRRHHLQCHHKLLLSRGPNGMQAPGDSGRDAGQGLEPKDHHLQYHHKLMLRRGGPNGMRPLELLAEMQVKDWNCAVITYSATISSC